MSHPLIAAVLIVKNEAANLKACLDTVADWVDEIVIMDSGSTDQTAAIAAEYGISSIPTVILFKDGAPIHTEVGAHDKAFYANLIEMHL